jgi:hypothetical protein
MNKYAWILVLMAGIASSGCHGMLAGVLHDGGPSTVGNGKLKQETRNIGNFSKIQIGGAVDVVVTVGPKPSLKLEAESNLLPLYNTRVEGDTFVMDHKGSISSNKSTKCWLTVPNLDGIILSGASNLHVTGLKTNSASIEISGASEVIAEGSAKDLDIEASGASKFDGAKLSVSTVKVGASGASNVKLPKVEKISGEATGASNVSYSGSPKVDVETSGASTVGKSN